MKTKIETEKMVIPKPLDKLSIFRSILSKFPGFCSYCGKKYIGCHSKNINVIFPVPQNGKCCPNGHEGYVDVFMGWGYNRQIFDLVQNPSNEQ